MDDQKIQALKGNIISMPKRVKRKAGYDCDSPEIVTLTSMKRLRLNEDSQSEDVVVD